MSSPGLREFDGDIKHSKGGTETLFTLLNPVGSMGVVNNCREGRGVHRYLDIKMEIFYIHTRIFLRTGDQMWYFIAYVLKITKQEPVYYTPNAECCGYCSFPSSVF